MNIDLGLGTEFVGVTALYASIFGLLIVPMSLFVAMRRIKARVSLLDGGDEILTRRIRAHANFIEYVPFAVVLMALSEVAGASDVFLHAMGVMLLVSRLGHYWAINVSPLSMTRRVSMIGTFAYFLIVSGWLLVRSVSHLIG